MLLVVVGLLRAVMALNALDHAVFAPSLNHAMAMSVRASCQALVERLGKWHPMKRRARKTHKDTHNFATVGAYPVKHPPSN
jgi:hypothetical protein